MQQDDIIYSFDDFSLLPMCVLKDDYSNGIRVGEVYINDVFRPNSKLLGKSARSDAGYEYTFTAYHFHEGVEILRINGGRAAVVVNNKIIEVEDDDIVVINPFEAHGIYLCDEGTKFSRTCLIFQPTDIFPSTSGGDTLFDRLKNFRFKNLISRAESRELCDCIDEIIELAERSDAGWSVAVIANLTKIYSLAISLGCLVGEEEIMPYQHEFMTRVADYIENNICSAISTAEAAKHCQYSTEHFCRMFKRYFGKTFGDYVNMYKIHKAKDMIDSGSWTSVSEIARELGFISQNNFSNMFKRHIGTTPSAYIKNKKKANRRSYEIPAIQS